MRNRIYQILLENQATEAPAAAPKVILPVQSHAIRPAELETFVEIGYEKSLNRQASENLIQGATMAFEVLGVIVVVGAIFCACRLLRTTKRQTARALWAFCGPYQSAEIAAKYLARACVTVFTPEEMIKQNEWLEKSAKIFHEWETQGQFESNYNEIRNVLMPIARGRAFEKAYQKMKGEVGQVVIEEAERLNKDIFANSGYRLEALQQPDGTVRLFRRQIWSDEEIKDAGNRDGEEVLNAVGRVLLAGQSQEAKKLFEFLRAINEANGGEDLETPQRVGTVWLALPECYGQGAGFRTG